MAVENDGQSALPGAMFRGDRSPAIAALFPNLCIKDGVVSVVFEPHPEHEGRPGWLQGGLAATVLDYVSASAASVAFGADALTGRLELRYQAPVRLQGGPYTVMAELARPATRRTATVNGFIRSADGDDLVRSTGLFVLVDIPTQ